MIASRQFLRKPLAAFITIWLSGFAMLALCQLPARAAGPEHCPLAKPTVAHCNKTKANAKADLVSTGTSQAFDCCGFIPAVFDKARKLERGMAAVEPAAGVAISTRRLPREVRAIRVTSYTSYRPIKDRIFIKNRVFRI